MEKFYYRMFLICIVLPCFAGGVLIGAGIAALIYWLTR